jgi:uncharacterized protein YjgD (DUF1641 family)
VEEKGLQQVDGLSQEALEDIFKLLKELESSGLLKALLGLVEGREELLSRLTMWIENNRNLVENFTLLLNALSSVDPGEVRTANSLTELLNLLKDPEVLSGLSLFLAFMRELGRNMR